MRVRHRDRRERDETQGPRSGGGRGLTRPRRFRGPAGPLFSALPERGVTSWELPDPPFDRAPDDRLGPLRRHVEPGQAELLLSKTRVIPKAMTSDSSGMFGLPDAPSI